MVALSVVLLLTSAMLHRIASGGEDDPSFFQIASGLVVASALPLAVGIAADVYVVFVKEGDGDWRSAAAEVSGFIVDGIDEAVAAVENVRRLSRVAVRRGFEKRFSIERVGRDYIRVYQSLADEAHLRTRPDAEFKARRSAIDERIGERPPGPVAARNSEGKASAPASPSRGPGNGILRAETGGRFQAQNEGERPEFGSQTATAPR